MSDPVQTPSGIPLEPVYGPADRAGEPPAPGTYPFTRGNFPSGYRGRLWTIRQYSGFGTAEESNQRYRYLLDQGGTGLSVALDLPDPVRVRLRRPRGRGGGRPGRRRARHAGRRRDPVRRHPARQDQHQLHDQRHRRDPAGVLRRGRGEAGRAAGEAPRHDPERHPQGVRLARHVDLAAGAVAAADRRHHRVLRGRGAAVQRDLRGRRALPRRRAPTPCRRWRSRSRTASPTATP